jgi:hypothetical protein
MDGWMIIVVPGCIRIIRRRGRRRRGEGVFVDESWYLISSSWLALLHSLELGLVKD